MCVVVHGLCALVITGLVVLSICLVLMQVRGLHIRGLPVNSYPQVELGSNTMSSVRSTRQ